MSGLPDGAFITSINGKQCTAIPKRAPPGNEPSTTAAPNAPPTQSEALPATTEPATPEDDPNAPVIPDESSTSPENPPAEQTTTSEQETTRVDPPETTAPPPPETTETSLAQAPETSELPAEPPQQPAPPPPPPPPGPPRPGRPPSFTLSFSSRPPRESSSSTLEPPPAFVTSASGIPTESAEQPAASTETTSSESPKAAIPLPVAPSEETSAEPSLPPSIAPPESLSVEPSAPLVVDTSEPPPRPTTAEEEQPTTAVGGLVTTIGVDGAQASRQPDREGSETGKAAGPGTVDGASDMPSKGVIIGSTIGAAAFIALIALLLCLLRKRRSQRRNTMLTPLTMPLAAEKGGVYEFDNGSVGPTPRSARIVAAMSTNLRAFGKSFGSRSPDNRDNSQFMVDESSRQSPVMAGVLSAKDRYRDWWSRLGEEAKFNWRVRHEQFGGGGRYPAATTSDNKQDFRSLADVGEQEAQRRRGSRSSHGSANSRDHFLSGLSVDLGRSDPFADSNAVPAAQAGSSYNNHNRLESSSFDDSNIKLPAWTVHPPSSYIAEVQRSRGRTMSTSEYSRPTSGVSTNRRSGYRSGQSFDSQEAARRTKFRSDPFDLEIEEVAPPTDTDLAHLPRIKSKCPALTTQQQSRAPSSSMYPSGVSSVSGSMRSIRTVSTGDWSDPGPDVGPAVARRGDSSAPAPSGDGKGGKGIGMAM